MSTRIEGRWSGPELERLFRELQTAGIAAHSWQFLRGGRVVVSVCDQLSPRQAHALGQAIRRAGPRTSAARD